MKTRILTAIAVLVSAYVHLKLWFDGFRDLHVVGPAFLLNAVAGLVIAAGLVLWRHWLPPLLAVGFGLSTLGAFVISATVGLYGVHEVWSGSYVLAAAASEVVAIVGGAAVLVLERPAATGPTSARQPEHRFALRRAHLH
ncbi:hypothetical protein ACT8ZV_05200 [Nocardioides sp. MAHUQ-72]|uniref:hypothetical protein n=1 Tax=unclassified Nocardioides TaxID=2615069 RepID=UPI00360F1916